MGIYVLILYARRRRAEPCADQIASCSRTQISVGMQKLQIGRSHPGNAREPCLERSVGGRVRSLRYGRRNMASALNGLLALLLTMRRSGAGSVPRACEEIEAEKG